jgi:hypothetical protein
VARALYGHALEIARGVDTSHDKETEMHLLARSRRTNRPCLTRCVQERLGL